MDKNSQETTKDEKKLSDAEKVKADFIADAAVKVVSKAMDATLIYSKLKDKFKKGK